MWVVLSIIMLGLILSIAKFRLKGKEIPNQINMHDHNQKVKDLFIAKELLRHDRQISVLYVGLIDFYDHEFEYTKKEKMALTRKLLANTHDMGVTIAICALARIESNKHRKENGDC